MFNGQSSTGSMEFQFQLQKIEEAKSHLAKISLPLKSLNLYKVY